MASVINLPAAPNTGLSALGSVLLGASSDYANRRRQDEVEARRRTERLTDIASEREDADRRYGRARSDRLADVSSEREYVEGRDEVKRGRQLEDVADQRYWEEKIRNKGGDEAQERLNQLTENEVAVAARMTTREKRLSAPEPTVTRDQVMSRALARARAATGKVTPSTADIEAEIPGAMEEAQTALNQAWQRDRLDAQEAQRIDAALLARIGAEKNTITNIFRRVGLAAANPPAAAPAPEAARPTLQSVQQGFAEQLRQQLAAQRAPAQASPTPSRLFNPENDPVIAREQGMREQEAQATRLAPIQAMESQLANVDQRIQQAQQMTAAPRIIAAGPTSVPPQQPGRGFQADLLSDLYTQQAELRRRIGALREPVTPNPTPAAQPAANWWMSPQQ